MKLHTFWSALPPRAKRSLQQWLFSPSHNLRDDVRKLYAHLREHDETGVSLDKDTVFTALYGDVAYNDHWLRQAQSFLLKNMEAFLVYQKLEDDALQTTFLLARVYEDLQLEKPFLQTCHSLQHVLKTAAIQDTDTLQQKKSAEKLVFQYHSQQQHSEENNLQALLLAQEKAFAAEKLRTVCTALSYQSKYNLAYDFGLLDPLLTQIERKNWHETEPAISLYYYIYKMNTASESEPFFKELREKLRLHRTCFTPSEYVNLFLGAINYAIKQTNTGDEAFFRPLFELYKEGIETQILLDENGQLSPYTYKNMAAIGLRIGEIKYIFEFIETYKKLLPTPQRRNYYEYNLARYYFTAKDFNKALPLLDKLTYGDIFLQLGAKVMLAKMYYELDEYDKLDAFLHNFNQFLYRKKELLGYHKQNYSNIIYCMKQLITYNSFDKAEVAKLQNEIENINPLTEKEWLLAQV